MDFSFLFSFTRAPNPSHNKMKRERKKKKPWGKGEKKKGTTNQKCTVFTPTGLFHMRWKKLCCVESSAIVLWNLLPPRLALKGLRRKEKAGNGRAVVVLLLENWSRRADIVGRVFFFLTKKRKERPCCFGGWGRWIDEVLLRTLEKKKKTRPVVARGETS